METIDEKIRAFLDRGYGYGIGYGIGSGDGYGRGSGDGDGSGDGCGIGEVNGRRIRLIDGVSTVIDSIRGNVAQGVILNRDFTFTPCYVVRGNGRFAHGRTLREAFLSLQEKLSDGATEEERLLAFKGKFPDYDTPYGNADLYAYHHVLTGSCKMGRDNFRKQHGLSLDGMMTVREFVALTKGSYGGGTVGKLPAMYGQENNDNKNNTKQGL